MVPGETRINTILTDLEDKTQTRISALGPVVSAADQRLFLKKLLKVRPAFWAIGGSPSRGMAPDIYKKYIFSLQRTGVPCILDADDEWLRLGIESKPFMIKPNEYEIERLVNRKLSGIQDYFGAARELVRRGIRIVIVSLGEKGALFVSEKEAFCVPGIPEKVTSKVGAGDSLVGGFVLGLFRKMSLERAAALGVAAGTSAVMRGAPRLCRRADIPSLLRKIRIRHLR